MPDTIRRETARLFFAIRPDSAVQAALKRMARKAVAGQQGGQCVKPENIHLTVLFLGDVESDRIDGLREIAGSVTAQMFSLSIQARCSGKRIALLWPMWCIIPPRFSHWPTR